jgi:hypothetical protein
LQAVTAARVRAALWFKARINFEGNSSADRQGERKAKKNKRNGMAKGRKKYAREKTLRGL